MGGPEILQQRAGAVEAGHGEQADAEDLDGGGRVGVVGEGGEEWVCEGVEGGGGVFVCQYGSGGVGGEGVFGEGGGGDGAL